MSRPLNPSMPIASIALLVALAACASGEKAATDSASVSSAPASTAGADSAAAANAATPSGAMIDPSTVTRDALAVMPGMTPAAAESLLVHQPYKDMVEVDAVLSKRLSEAARDSVYTVLWKPIDLNKASKAEILLIPGVGAKMQHEFEEYRPYKSIEQFRREIGKYVDANEVARLERYVVVVP